MKRRIGLYSEGIPSENPPARHYFRLQSSLRGIVDVSTKGKEWAGRLLAPPQ